MADISCKYSKIRNGEIYCKSSEISGENIKCSCINYFGCMYFPKEEKENLLDLENNKLEEIIIGKKLLNFRVKK
jgi:hypothetical protein